MEENEQTESSKQRLLNDISVKTSSKTLSTPHKGLLAGRKKAVSSSKLAKNEIQPILNDILEKQYLYDNSKIRFLLIAVLVRTHQYSNKEKPIEYANFVVVQLTSNKSCFLSSVSMIKISGNFFR